MTWQPMAGAVRCAGPTCSPRRWGKRARTIRRLVRPEIWAVAGLGRSLPISRSRRTSSFGWRRERQQPIPDVERHRHCNPSLEVQEHALEPCAHHGLAARHVDQIVPELGRPGSNPPDPGPERDDVAGPDPDAGLLGQEDRGQRLAATEVEDRMSGEKDSTSLSDHRALGPITWSSIHVTRSLPTSETAEP